MLTLMVSLYSLRESSRNFLLSFSINLEIHELQRSDVKNDFSPPSYTSFGRLINIPLLHPREIFLGDKVHPGIIEISWVVSGILFSS